MNTLEILQDTIPQIIQANSILPQIEKGDAFNNFIDICYKISMIIIALFNFFYAYKLNMFKKKKDEEKETNEKIQKEKERKISLLKGLVLDHNLKHLYIFFTNIENDLSLLKKKEADKKQIEQQIQIRFKELGENFIISLSAAVPHLGKSIQDYSDEMRDSLINNIADEGINLWVEHYYNDKIKMVVDSGKVKMIKALFDYNGE